MSQRSRGTRVYRAATALLVTVVLVTATAFVLAERTRAIGAAAIETEWHSNRVDRVVNLGATRSVEILPLVNWHARSPDLKTEAGVAYLVRTDDATILYDLGWNEKGEDPSPLLHNMIALGVTLSEIDAIFLSHAHRDHVGGADWAGQESFSLGRRQISLAGKHVFAPAPLKYPDVQVSLLSQPQRLFSGIATTGPIPRSLFIGRIEEQALVVNVRGKGLVLIVGCGHQTLAKLLQRVDEAFEEPLFGIVGDLHYPVPNGRIHTFGIDLQRRFASGDGPTSPIAWDQVVADVSSLESRKLGLVAIGGHDTSDEVIEEFGRRFGARFHRAEVGAPIRVEDVDTALPGSPRADRRSFENERHP